MIPHIPTLQDPALAAALQAKIDGKTKPLGALGQLEALMLKLGLILGSETPTLREPQLMVFAGDHGLAAQGVSAYPSDVTWQMVENFLAGGAAVSVLARQHGLALTVVDAGVAHDFAPRAGLVIAKIAAGTADSSAQAAMTAALAHELGPQVRVNGVAPGAVMWPESGKSYANKDEIITRTPLKRAGSAQDVADAVLWLLRDAKFVTGQIVRVDGGRSLAI